MRREIYRIKYTPGSEATGVEAELCHINGSDPYCLARVEIGYTGFECTFDPRRKPDITEKVLSTAWHIQTATAHHEWLVDVVEECIETFNIWREEHLREGTDGGFRRANRCARKIETCAAVLKSVKESEKGSSDDT